MSQKVNSFSTLIIATAVIIGGVVFGISSCHDNGKSEMPASNVDSNTMTTVTTPNDSGAMSNPSDNTKINTMDTSMASNKMNKDTMSTSKMAASKKGKKGKVMVMMNQKGTGSMDMDKEGYYSNVEVWPSYPGGQKALESFFENNIEYPQAATDNGTEGTVNINFAVDENGKVSSPKVMGAKVGSGIDEEALRVFNKMPTWTAGKIKGKNVKTRFTLPVRFQLTD